MGAARWDLIFFSPNLILNRVDWSLEVDSVKFIQVTSRVIEMVAAVASLGFISRGVGGSGG